MDTRVEEIMRTSFASLKKSDPIAKAIDLFISNPDMVFPVVDSRGRIIGEINQHELLKLLIPPRDIDEEIILGPLGMKELLERQGNKVGDLMKTHDIKVKKGTKVVEAARLMLETEVRTLEVVDEEGNPIGFVSEVDILRYLKGKLEEKK